MKKLILTILTTITILGVNAQGNNLEYSQSIYLDYINPSSGVPGNTYHSVGTFSVPANKTFKITSSSCTQSSGGDPDIYGSTPCLAVKINRHKLDNNSILWLPSGIYTVYTMVSGNNWRSAVAITGLEFNIVP